MKKIFGIVNTPDFVICESYLRPKDSVEMNEINPDSSIFIASIDGTWILKNDYKELRKQTILKEWPIEKQLEAITESFENPPRLEKLELLKNFLKEVRKQYPK